MVIKKMKVKNRAKINIGHVIDQENADKMYREKDM